MSQLVLPPPAPSSVFLQAPQLQPVQINYADTSGLNSYWVYAGAITGAALLTALFIAIVLKIQQRRRHAWYLSQRARADEEAAYSRRSDREGESSQPTSGLITPNAVFFVTNVCDQHRKCVEMLGWFLV
jgi:hypothetical protein